MLFDEEIKNAIIYNENQEEDNSFDTKSKEVVTVFRELVRKVKYQISKLKNKNVTRKRQRNEDNRDRKKKKIFQTREIIYQFKGKTDSCKVN